MYIRHNGRKWTAVFDVEDVLKVSMYPIAPLFPDAAAGVQVVLAGRSAGECDMLCNDLAQAQQLYDLITDRLRSHRRPQVPQDDVTLA